MNHIKSTFIIIIFISVISLSVLFAPMESDIPGWQGGAIVIKKPVIIDRPPQKIDINVKECKSLNELKQVCINTIKGNKKMIDDKRHIDWHFGNKPGKAEAIKTLGLIGSKDVVPFLLENLNIEKSKYVRSNYIIVLGWLKDKRAVNKLIDILKNDEYDSNRYRAALALGSIWDRKAVPSLETALKDKDIRTRQSATDALKTITGKDYKFPKEK